MTTYATPAELEAGLDHLRAAPRGEGVVEMIVRRPVVDERELLDEAELDLVEGLVGDSWRARGRSGGRPANEKAQITVMNARSTALVAGDRERWPLAGDQLYVDFDLSGENLPKDRADTDIREKIAGLPDPGTARRVIAGARIIKRELHEARKSQRPFCGDLSQNSIERE